MESVGSESHYCIPKSSNQYLFKLYLFTDIMLHMNQN